MCFQSGNLSNYGNKELETLLAYYGTAKITQSGEVVPVIVDTENCRIERKFSKVLLVRGEFSCRADSRIMETSARLLITGMMSKI